MAPTTAPSLTLVVAATHPEMGIGLRGTLPWPQLRSEMAYFARVTRRAPPTLVNAVIMGRRTWDSIPTRFRPLKSRLNVVITRQPESFAKANPSSINEGPVVVGSLEAAVALVEERQRLEGPRKERDDSHTAGSDLDQKAISRAFVIGGAEVYKAALDCGRSERILLTRVHTKFECDTFFPLKLEPPSVDQAPAGKATDEWTQRSQSELNSWAGENLKQETHKERDVEWEFEMWEKQLQDE